MKYLIFISGFLLLTAAGCVPKPSPVAPRPEPTATVRKKPAPAAVPAPAVGAGEAIREALRRQLDVRINESLENYAAEHAENRRTLAAASALQKEEDAVPAASLLRRREALEHAIGFAHLLGTGAGDLPAARRPREIQLLCRQTAAALIRWQIRDLLPRRERQEVELELKLLTGWTLPELEKLRDPGVVTPYALANDLESLQQFAVFNRPECGHLRIHADLAAELRRAGESRRRTELRLIDLLYRLPLGTMERDVDPVKLVRTAIGAAVALQVAGDLQTLNLAYESYRLAELRADLDPTPLLTQKKRRAAAVWQLAYVDLMTDLGSTDYGMRLPPLKPFEAPELTPESARLMEQLNQETLP